MGKKQTNKQKTGREFVRRCVLERGGDVEGRRVRTTHPALINRRGVVKEWKKRRPDAVEAEAGGRRQAEARRRTAYFFSTPRMAAGWCGVAPPSLRPSP